MNNQSTGAVFCDGNITYITDCKDYSGTYIYDVYGNRAGKIDALMWYAVKFENNIYFSNQSCNDCLYRLNTQTGVVEKAADVPVKNLVLYNDHILFIDERDLCIWAYNCRTWSMFKAAEVAAQSFTLVEGVVYYSSKTGIGSVNLATRHQGMICPSVTGGLDVLGGYIVFSDIAKGGCLMMLSPSTGQLFNVSSIMTDSFAIYGNSIFASNENEGKSISKIDVQSGSIIRILGESAYNLTVCGNFLYFTDEQKNWCRMTTSGENFTKIVF